MIENFEELKKEGLKCTRCGLCQGRHNVVFGVGNPNARVLLVGEGPGENEDLQGEPFVGRAGKLLDTIADDGFWKKTIARFLCFLFRRNYRKAAAAYPDAADKMQEMLRSQQAAEKANASIDRAADATAVFTSFVCESLSEDSAVREVLRVFGYQTGRWIYLMDAADDLPGDLRKNRFNPFRQVYLKYPQGYEIYAGEVLQQTASQLRLAYELLPLHSFRDILDNVIYDGLEIRQAECLFRKHSQPSDLYPRLARRGRLPREEGDMTYSFGKEEMI